MKKLMSAVLLFVPGSTFATSAHYYVTINAPVTQSTTGGTVHLLDMPDYTIEAHMRTFSAGPVSDQTKTFKLRADAAVTCKSPYGTND